MDTRELAEYCCVNENKRLLNVASGTGETSCYLAQEFKCNASGRYCCLKTGIN